MSSCCHTCSHSHVTSNIFWVEDQLANALRFWVCDSITGFQRIGEVCSALHCSVLFFWRFRNGHVALRFH